MLRLMKTDPFQFACDRQDEFSRNCSKKPHISTDERSTIDLSKTAAGKRSEAFLMQWNREGHFPTK